MIAVSRSRHKSPLCTILGMENICTAVDIPIHLQFSIPGMESICTVVDILIHPTSYIHGMVNTFIRDAIPIHQTFYILGTVSISIEVGILTRLILSTHLTGNISIVDVILILLIYY